MEENTLQETQPNDESKAADCSRTMVSYVGPLPLPRVLQGYGEIDPTFPERIMADFERNSRHARDQEAKALEMQARDTRTGQWMAFLVIMTGMVGSMTLAYLDKDAAAIATAVGTAAMIFKGAFKK